MSSSDLNNGAMINPVLTAYEGFLRDTPLVSRYVMTTLVVTYLISIVMDGVNYSLSNIPYFSLGELELYRIILSPLLCGSLISLGFAYFSFLDHGKRLEFSMGSAQFGWLFFSLGAMVNVAYVLLAYTLQLVTSDSSWLFVRAGGIWTVLFPLIAIECVKAPPHSVRRFVMWNIPTLYYPLVLVIFFSLLGGYSLSNWVALVIGYAHGHGYLENTKVSTDTCKKWEDTVLVNFTRREGWVFAWNEEIAASSPQVCQPTNRVSSWRKLCTVPERLLTNGMTYDWLRLLYYANYYKQGLGIFLPSEAGEASGTVATVEAFPSGGGRQLGGPTRRAVGTCNAEARAARLKALEASSNNPSTTEGDDNV
jgi:membrane associated rhomboid family serine protease